MAKKYPEDIGKLGEFYKKNFEENLDSPDSSVEEGLFKRIEEKGLWPEDESKMGEFYKGGFDAALPVAARSILDNVFADLDQNKPSGTEPKQISFNPIPYLVAASVILAIILALVFLSNPNVKEQRTPMPADKKDEAPFVPDKKEDMEEKETEEIKDEGESVTIPNRASSNPLEAAVPDNKQSAADDIVDSILFSPNPEPDIVTTAKTEKQKKKDEKKKLKEKQKEEKAKNHGDLLDGLDDDGDEIFVPD